MKLNFYFIFGEIWDIIAFYTKSWSTKMVFQTDYMIASYLLITSGLTLTQSEKISLQKYSVDSSIFPKASFIFRCSNHSRLKIHFFFFFQNSFPFSLVFKWLNSPRPMFVSACVCDSSSFPKPRLSTFHPAFLRNIYFYSVILLNRDC